MAKTSIKPPGQLPKRTQTKTAPRQVAPIEREISIERRASQTGSQSVFDEMDIASRRRNRTG